MRPSFFWILYCHFISKADTGEIARLDEKFAKMDREFTWNIKIDGIWKDDFDDGDSCCYWSFCIKDTSRDELNKPYCVAAMYENVPDDWVTGPLEDKLIEVQITPHFSDEVMDSS